MKSRLNQKDMKKLEFLYNSNQFIELETETKNLLKKHSNVANLYNILGFALQKQGKLNQTHP